MNKKKLAITLLLLTLTTASQLPLPTLAATSVGVKEGDWIEYHVAYIGTPSEGHDVVWAKMEILNVKESSVTVKITANSSEGEQDIDTSTINFETGDIQDAFIIPANLEAGDTFLDEHRGNVTITGTRRKTEAGAERTLIYAVTADSTTYWDQATGVAVESHAALANFTMITMAERTNMWQPTLQGFEPTAAFALTVTVLGVTLLLVALLVFRSKKRTPSQNNSP